MSRNDPRPTTRWLTHDLRRSRGLWLSIALVVGIWCSRLAGQNAESPTSPSPNLVSDTPAPFRMSQPGRKITTRSQIGISGVRQARSPAPTIGSTRPLKPGATSSNPVRRDSAVVPASHEELSGTAPDNFNLSPEVWSSNLVPSPLPPVTLHARPAAAGPSLMFPSERTIPPQITGSHLGLQPGETATERSLRLMTVIADLEQQNAELADQNAKLNAELKAKEAKLHSGTLQINAARKELSLAKQEFQRLRKEIVDLREKFRSAEQENASLMRSLSPLLKQILERDDEPTTKD